MASRSDENMDDRFHRQDDLMQGNHSGALTWLVIGFLRLRDPAQNSPENLNRLLYPLVDDPANLFITIDVSNEQSVRPSEELRAIRKCEQVSRFTQASPFSFWENLGQCLQENPHNLHAVPAKISCCKIKNRPFLSIVLTEYLNAIPSKPDT